MQIPNLKGESLRDAMELLSVLQVTVKAEGEGYVASQTLTEDNGQRVVTLTLEPPDGNVNTEENETQETQEDVTGDSP